MEQRQNITTMASLQFCYWFSLFYCNHTGQNWPPPDTWVHKYDSPGIKSISGRLWSMKKCVTRYLVCWFQPLPRACKQLWLFATSVYVSKAGNTPCCTPGIWHSGEGEKKGFARSRQQQEILIMNCRSARGYIAWENEGRYFSNRCKGESTNTCICFITCLNLVWWAESNSESMLHHCLPFPQGHSAGSCPSWYPPRPPGLFCLAVSIRPQYFKNGMFSQNTLRCPQVLQYLSRF